MEAKLATGDKARMRALGAAMYLDPASERIAGFPATLKSRALEQYALANPFRMKQRPSPKFIH